MAFRIDSRTRLYVESSVLADWFLIRTIERDEVREALQPKVGPSRDLIEYFLSEKRQMRSCTSEWSLAEAASVIRRSRIELSLFYDGVPLRLYDRLKDTPRYSLNHFQTRQIEKELSIFRNRARGQVKIRILPSLARESTIRFYITQFGLEVADAFHLAIARRFRCDFLVTRDNDFICKKRQLETIIKIVNPAHMLNMIRTGKSSLKES